MNELPILFLDIDGVLNPLGHSAPPGYESVSVGKFEAHLSEDHGAWLRGVAGRAELVWATTWEHDANVSLAPLLGLPELPVVEFNEARTGDTWKLDAVRQRAGRRPAVWIDDELYHDAHAWAECRSEPTLLIRTSGHAGLTRREMETVDRFLDELEEHGAGGENT